MNELTERLTVSQAIIMGGADPTVEAALNLASRWIAIPPISVGRTSTRVPGPCTSKAA